MPGLIAGFPTHNFGIETPTGYAWPFSAIVGDAKLRQLKLQSKKIK